MTSTAVSTQGQIQQLVLARFLRDDSLVMLGPDSRPVWEIKFEDRRWRAGKILKTPDGDLLAFHYGPISNSGADIVRFNPLNGKVRWRATCGALPNIAHSEYCHDVDVQLVNNQLRVLSIGSYGRFVEWLDFRTGQQLRRAENPK